MQPSEYDEPHNEIDRRIFHILSHGQKEQKEIVRLLSTARFSEKSIRRRIRSLSENYSWAAENEGGTYYYRTDVGRQPSLNKPPADYSNIEELLSGIEVKLGIRSQNDNRVTNTQAMTLPQLFNDLLTQSNQHGRIFTTEGHLKRFFRCFDKMVEQTANGYSSEDVPPNYPPKTHGLFYTIVARQHESWKEGQANVEFDSEVRKRLEDLIDLLNFVPSEIGNPVIRIQALVDVEKARSGFEQMIRSNNYTVGELMTHAESCYVYSNDTDTLFNDLSMIAASCDNHKVRQKIEEIKKLTSY